MAPPTIAITIGEPFGLVIRSSVHECRAKYHGAHDGHEEAAEQVRVVGHKSGMRSEQVRDVDHHVLA